jgi:hypothetical protein
MTTKDTNHTKGQEFEPPRRREGRFFTGNTIIFTIDTVDSWDYTSGLTVGGALAPERGEGTAICRLFFDSHTVATDGPRAGLATMGKRTVQRSFQTGTAALP